MKNNYIRARIAYRRAQAAIDHKLFIYRINVNIHGPVSAAIRAISYKQD